MSYRDRDERGGRSQPPLPKPYEFVPLGNKRTSVPLGHERYQQLNGTIYATLVARSPVHVASGLLQTTNDKQYPMVKAHYRSQGQPTIPATSLKGCIRSILEAISPSSIGVTRARPLPREAEPSRSLDRLDVAQRLFGTLGYQGQVRFGDAVLQSGTTEIVPTPQLFRPRSDSPGTYFDGSRPKGRKFYLHGKLARGNLPLEACPVGSRLPFQIDFENLTGGEIGLLLFALGQGEPKLWPKLGGGKPACLGTVEVVELRVTILDTRAAYADFDAAPADAPTAPLLQAARDEQLVLDAPFAALADALRWPREDRDCPNRNY
jgi:hypothetical protein